MRIASVAFVCKIITPGDFICIISFDPPLFCICPLTFPSGSENAIWDPEPPVDVNFILPSEVFTSKGAAGLSVPIPT